LTHDMPAAQRAATGWRASWRGTRCWRAFVIGIAIGGCRDSACLLPPCPEGRALSIVLTSATTGAPVTTGTLTVTAPVTTAEACSGSCDLYGPSGAYTFDVSAPGFVTVHDSVVVHGTNPRCGCGYTTTVNVAIALVPAAGSDVVPTLIRPLSNEVPPPQGAGKGSARVARIHRSW